MMDGTITLLCTFFQRIPFPRSLATSWVNAEASAWVYTVSLPLFIRHYLENPVWFFLSPLTYMLKFSRYMYLKSD